MLDTLIVNTAVVTVNRSFDSQRPGVVGIRNGRFAVAGPSSPEAPLPDSRSSIDAGVPGWPLPGKQHEEGIGNRPSPSTP